jgi:hypothetical protein
MTRGGLLVGAVLLAGAGVCASSASPVAITAGGFIGPGSLTSAADADRSFADTTVSESLAAKAFAIPIPGIDDAAIFVGFADDLAENQRAAAFPSLDFASGSTDDAGGEPLGAPARPAAVDVAGVLSPAEDFRTVSSGVSVDLVDDLAAAPTEANEDTNVDIEDAVPALAALSLLVAGLLLVGFVRRRRRAAIARRVKRSFERRGGRLARNRSR